MNDNASDRADSINIGYLISLIITITLASTQFGLNLPISSNIYNYIYNETSIPNFEELDPPDNKITKYILSLAYPCGGIFGGIIFMFLLGITKFKIGPRKYLIGANWLNSFILFLLSMILLFWGITDKIDIPFLKNNLSCNDKLIQTIMFIFAFLQGSLSAYYIVLVPLYLKQLAPLKSRGACVCTFQLMITIGNCGASIIDYLIKNSSPKDCFEKNLHLIAIIYTPMIISIIQNILFKVLIKNESPMFLAIKDFDLRKSIKDRNSFNNPSVNVILNRI